MESESGERTVVRLVLKRMLPLGVLGLAMGLVAIKLYGMWPRNFTVTVDVGPSERAGVQSVYIEVTRPDRPERKLSWVDIRAGEDSNVPMTHTFRLVPGRYTFFFCIKYTDGTERNWRSTTRVSGSGSWKISSPQAEP